MGLKSFMVLWSLLAFWGLISVYYTVTPDALSSQPGTQEQPGEAIEVDPRRQAGLADGAIAVCGADGSISNVIILHNMTIENLLFVQQQEAVSIPRGELLEGPDAGQHNASWFQQSAQQRIAAAKSTIDSCEGSLEFFRKGLQYY